MSPTKKKKKSKPQAAQQSSVTKSFSASQPAGKPVSTCPLKCNLKLLKILEPKGGTDEKHISRGVQITQQGTRDRKANPTMIASGDKFQITANSKLAGEPRELQISVTTEATCAGKKHPLLTWKDSTEEKSVVATSGEAKFYRQSLTCDGAPGFFSFLNAIFAMGSTRGYLVTATSCGNSPVAKGISCPQMVAVVEVFPGDQFEAEIELPAAKKSELTDKKSANWTTDRDKQSKEIEEEGEEAGKAYDASDPKLRGAWGTKKEYEKGFEDKKKEELGYEDREPEGATIELTQKDGGRTMTADPKEIIDLYNFARATEAGIKKVQEWLEDVQFGPGASLKAEIEILVMSLKAEWGYQEYTDNRVYLAASGSLSVEVIKGSIEANFGFKSAGLLDVIGFLKGSGAIKLTASIKHEDPDELFKPDVSLAGEFGLSGGAQGQAMWIVKAKAEVKTGFSVELGHITIFQKTALLKGELEIKLAAMQMILTASCWGIGSAGTTHELSKERKWPIPMGE